MAAAVRSSELPQLGLPVEGLRLTPELIPSPAHLRCTEHLRYLPKKRTNADPAKVKDCTLKIAIHLICDTGEKLLAIIFFDNGNTLNDVYVIAFVQCVCFHYIFLPFPNGRVICPCQKKKDRDGEQDKNSQRY